MQETENPCWASLCAPQPPDNAREVRLPQHACETALILCDEDVLTRRHLPHSVGGGTEEEGQVQPGTVCEPLDENFKKWLLAAIENCDGNLSTLAKTYGISRITLYRKVRRLEIDVSQFRSKGA
ncbi:hypothetical protein CA601_09830 [Paraburkholderia hospita]|nr:hypothetical protein CA601_09830 [Paraburkholderia hospita]